MKKITFISIFTIWLMSSTISCEDLNFLNYSEIHFDVRKSAGNSQINIRTESEGKLRKINCQNCKVHENQTIECVNDGLVPLDLEIEKQKRMYRVAFNMSCQPRNGMKNYLPVTDLKSHATIHEFELSWNHISDEISRYIIYYMDDKHQYTEYTENELPFHTLTNLKEKTLYHICIAAIDQGNRTSSYRCIQSRTDFVHTGPVTDVKVHSQSDSLFISWNKPKYQLDNPQGYIINYNDDRKCRTVVVNIGTNRVPNDLQCSTPRVIYWQNLQILVISGLRAGSKYQVEIFPYNNDKPFKELILTVRTKDPDNLIKQFSALQNFMYKVSETKIGKLISFSYNKKIIDISVFDKTKSLINKTFLACQEKENINVNLTLRSDQGKIIVPYNVLCQLRNNENKILKLNAHFFNKNIYVNWKIQRASLITLLIYSKKFFKNFSVWSEPSRSFIISNVKPNTMYYICMSTINVTNTDGYRCIYKKIEPLPIDLSETMDIVSLDQMVFLKLANLRQRLNEGDGYIFNYKRSDGTCKSLIINKVKEEFMQHSCKVQEQISITDFSKYIPIKNLKSNTKYALEVIATNGEHALSKTSQYFQTTQTGCFYDCFVENYSGIRTMSENNRVCISKNETRSSKHNKTPRSHLCSATGQHRPSCFTDLGRQSCKVPQCTSFSKVSGCVKNLDTEVSGSSVTISWISPQYSYDAMGYITVLHNSERCLQSHLQTCKNCKEKIRKNFFDFYGACQGKTETEGIEFRTKFLNLQRNQIYFVYIIPILDDSNIGAIKKLSFTTGQSKILPIESESISDVTRSPRTILKYSKINSVTQTWKTYAPKSDSSEANREIDLDLVDDLDSNKENDKTTNQDYVSNPNIDGANNESNSELDSELSPESEQIPNANELNFEENSEFESPEEPKPEINPDINQFQPNLNENEIPHTNGYQEPRPEITGTSDGSDIEDYNEFQPGLDNNHGVGSNDNGFDIPMSGSFSLNFGDDNEMEYDNGKGFKAKLKLGKSQQKNKKVLKNILKGTKEIKKIIKKGDKIKIKEKINSTKQKKYLNDIKKGKKITKIVKKYEKNKLKNTKIVIKEKLKIKDDIKKKHQIKKVIEMKKKLKSKYDMKLKSKMKEKIKLKKPLKINKKPIKIKLPKIIKSPLQGKSPIIKKPIIRRPIIRKPIIRKPIIRRPIIRKPIIRKPIIRKPIIRKPIIRKPIIRKPIIQRPIIRKPIIRRPIIRKPIIRKPIIRKPIIRRPIIRKPIIRKPIIRRPIIRKPIIRKPIIRKPIIRRPIIRKPIVRRPVIRRPIIRRPIIRKPIVRRPVIRRPIVRRPVIRRPVIRRPPAFRRPSVFRRPQVVHRPKVSRRIRYSG